MTTTEEDLLVLSEVLFSAKSLTPAEATFVRVWELEAEVNNGGFSQFYFNSAGDHAASTVDALEEIGAGRTAEIVRAANSVFPGAAPPSDTYERQDLLEALGESGEEKLETWDGEFFKYQDNLSELLCRFVDNNRNAIRGT